MPVSFTKRSCLVASFILPDIYMAWDGVVYRRLPIHWFGVAVLWDREFDIGASFYNYNDIVYQ